MSTEDSSSAPDRSRRLRGRDDECARLDELVGSIRGGESRALVVRGEAGIGKTALLEYLVESAADLTVVRSVGVESEFELAYASLHQLCAPLLDRLPRLAAPQRQALQIVFGLNSGSPPDPFLVALGVLSLLTDAAGEHPLLYVVDDAQWLDQASARTLGFVARRLVADPVGIVFAVRQAGDALAHIPELEVQGLPPADAIALLESAVPVTLDERVRSRILIEARGNPLALLELHRGLTPAEFTGGLGVRDAPPLSGRIEKSFARQLDALPKDSQLLLLVAAAEPVGDPLLLWRAAEQLDLKATAADAAEAQGLITIEERVAFRHPLARSAVYQTAEPHERRTVHRALGEATDRQVDPDRRAWHLASAASGPDEAVAQELELSAGRALARGGLAAATAFMHRALALTGDPTRRADRALDAAGTSLQAGRFDIARDALDVAESAPLTDFQRARVELLRGQIALFLNLGGDAAALLLDAAQGLDELAPELARDTYLDAWFAALISGPVSTGVSLRDISQAARTVPRPPGDARPSDLLLDALSTLITEGGGAAADLLRKATEAFINEPSLPEASLRWSWLTVVPTYVLWDEDATAAICERSLQGLRQTGALARLPLDLRMLSLFTLRCGDYAGSEQFVAEIATVIEATGATLAPYPEMMLAASRGREAEAEALITLADREAAALGQGFGIQACDWMRAVLYNGLGRYQDAMAAALAASEETPELYISAWATIELLEAATRNNRPEVAQMALARIVAFTTVAASDSALGMQARCRALLSDGEIADGLYREAIERLGRSRLRPDLARAHLLYGEWLRRENRRFDARVQLRSAYEQFVSIGMEAFADRARGELLATGEKVRKRTVETRDDLTAQESQIARLARDGLSNPEIGERLFLSPRTVEWHLRKVFGKLGIRSRRELARALPERDANAAAV